MWEKRNTNRPTLCELKVVFDHDWRSAYRLAGKNTNYAARPVRWKVWKTVPGDLRVLINLLCSTGMRFGSLASLRPTDIISAEGKTFIDLPRLKTDPTEESAGDH